MTHRIQNLLTVGLVLCILVPSLAFYGTAASMPFTTALFPFWYEDFDQPLDPLNYYMEGSVGSAVVDDGSFLLTENWSYQYGRIFFLQKTYMSGFDAEFDLYLGEDNGSDGLAFHFCPVYDYPHSDGGSLNANCPNGYFIAFDTHNDVTPPYNNEIYLAKGSVENRLILVEIIPAMDNDTWRHCRVSLADGAVTVTLDTNNVIDAFKIPGYAPLGGYFGFSAATGGGSNHQRVDNIEISAPRLFQVFLPVMRK